MALNDRRLWLAGHPPNGEFILNRDSPQARGLVAWYPLGPGQYGLTGDGLNMRHLTPYASPIRVGGERGAVASFTKASSQYLAHLGSAFLDYPFTMACWFRYLTTPNSFGRDVLMAVSDRDDGYDRDQLNIYRPSDVNIEAFTTTNFDATGAARVDTVALVLGTWYHATGIFAAANSRTIYLNANQNATNTTSLSPTTRDTIAIGACVRSSGPTGYVGAEIADARIYNRSLSVLEIEAIYRNSWELYEPVVRWFVVAAPAGGNHYLMSATATAATSTPDGVALLAQLVASAAAQAVTDTDAVAAEVVRATSAVALAATDTPAVASEVERSTSAVATAVTATPDDVAIEAQVVAAAAAHAITDTGAVAAEVAREVAAVAIAVSLTPTVALTMARLASAVAQAVTDTGAVAAEVLREAVTAALAQTDTGAVTPDVERVAAALAHAQTNTGTVEIEAQIVAAAAALAQTATGIVATEVAIVKAIVAEAVTNTGDVALNVTGILVSSATATAVTGTGAVGLEVARSAEAQAHAVTATPDDVVAGLSLPMAAQAHAVTATPDDVLAVRLLPAGATALAVTTTPIVGSQVRRAAQATALAQTNTPVVSTTMVIAVAILALAVTRTPDDVNLLGAGLLDRVLFRGMFRGMFRGGL